MRKLSMVILELDKIQNEAARIVTGCCKLVYIEKIKTRIGIGIFKRT